MTRHDPTVRLNHMLDHAIEAVELLGGQSDEQVGADRTLQLALTRLVEVVGEAASKVPKDVREQYPQVPWRDATATRNLLIHGYDVVRHDILCRTIRGDFPPLIAQLRQVLGR